MKTSLIKQKNQLVYSSFTLLKNGLMAIGNPSFNQWLECGEFIKRANGAVHFWIGDWINFGERKYGEKYSQALDESQYDYQTLRNDAWIARRVELSRRRDNLSFSHHADVAELEPEDQEILLQKAVNEKLNRHRFRRVVRSFKLKLVLPELSEKELSISYDDFESVEPIVDLTLRVVEQLKEIDFEKLRPEAREWLIAEMKKAIGAIASLIVEHEK